jgi:hypothetical protein
MNAMIVYKQDQYRLITDGNGRFAVVEARAGKVYSLHAQGRREAQDTEGGMELVVGNDWQARDQARRRFHEMLRSEEHYSQVIW